jgi:microcystin-dependent protein
MALKNGRTTAALQTILVGSVIPPGVIQAFGGGTVPSGWLLCDGSTASRSTYAGLFAAVGVVHGEGNGTTTFHLPDLRGRFLRGADNMGTGAAGRDLGVGERTPANTGGATGATVGSVQAAATLAHNHVQNAHEHLTLSSARVATQDPSNLSSGNYAAHNGINGAFTTNYSITATGSSPDIARSQSVTPTNQSTIGTESRPQNANASYIIKV